MGENRRKVRVAIVGVGNCAASLVQGVQYYRDADPNARVPGLMHVRFGEYHVSDVEFVAAFDVDAKKVGRDLSEAIVASENNTIKIADVRLRILEGRRRMVEQRREGLRTSLARTTERLDRYTLELQRHGLESVDREVRWLSELIDIERRENTDPG